jgi:hypothetical protein
MHDGVSKVIYVLTKMYELSLFQLGPMNDCCQSRSEELGYNAKVVETKHTAWFSPTFKVAVRRVVIRHLPSKRHRAYFKAVTVVGSEKCSLYITLRSLDNVVTLHQHATRSQVFHMYH